MSLQLSHHYFQDQNSKDQWLILDCHEDAIASLNNQKVALAHVAKV